MFDSKGSNYKSNKERVYSNDLKKILGKWRVNIHQKVEFYHEYECIGIFECFEVIKNIKNSFERVKIYIILKIYLFDFVDK